MNKITMKNHDSGCSTLNSQQKDRVIVEFYFSSVSWLIKGVSARVADRTAHSVVELKVFLRVSLPRTARSTG